MVRLFSENTAIPSLLTSVSDLTSAESVTSEAGIVKAYTPSRLLRLRFAPFILTAVTSLSADFELTVNVISVPAAADVAEGIIS